MNKIESKIHARNPLLVVLWSLGLFILMQAPQYVGTFVASIISGISFGSIMKSGITDAYPILGRGITIAIIGIPLALIVTKYLWRRPKSWIRLEFKPGYLLGGLLGGIILPIIAVLLISLFANVSLEFNPRQLSHPELAAMILGIFAYMLFIGTAEELVFRGMTIREWAYKWGWGISIIIGGIYFGVLHLVSILPELTVVKAIWIILAAVSVTTLFTALYIRSKSLWLPIGFHAGWNFCLDGILGATISGHGSGTALCKTDISGAGIFTGGTFGMESSLLTICVYLIAAYLVIRLFRKKSNGLLSSKEYIV